MNILKIGAVMHHSLWSPGSNSDLKVHEVYLKP